jgi:hypothetical protein
MRRSAAAVALLVLGLAQMAGDVLGIPVLKGLAAATAASPAPRVFSTWRGWEGFSARFFIEWEDRSGVVRDLELTPEVYARLRGPYNRRNAFGAVLAAGPVLAADPRLRPLFEPVARHALCGSAPVLRELGIDPSLSSGPVVVRYLPRDGGNVERLATSLPAPCS